MIGKGGDRFTRARRRQELEQMAQRLDAERDAAALKVEPLLRMTPQAEWTQLARNPDLQTCGALERLGRIIGDAHTRDPRDALAVAELAVTIAESIPEGAYPAILHTQFRCLAWKDLGKSLRLLARYEEAFNALYTAEETLRQFGFMAYDLAVVQVNLAVAFQETNQFDQSLALLKPCKDVFTDYGDRESFVQCVLLEGMSLQRLRRYREARETYLLLLAWTRGISKGNLAALHHAIGLCCVDLGDFSEAESNLTHAISLYRDLGQSINALKAELCRGKLFLQRGDFVLAVSHLRPVRRGFLRSTLAEEAGLCGLHIVKALLMLERAGEAERLARRVVDEFTHAALSARAITALSYLTEAITAKKASATGDF